MTKRRLDDSSFANVLRQKIKEDPVIKQQAAQNTFALLMKAQQRPQPRVMAEPSYKYFNSTAPVENKASCYKCKDKLIYDTCAHCEYAFCGNCLAHCVSCQSIFCGACSVIDYSMSTNQVFCLPCTHN